MTRVKSNVASRAKRRRVLKLAQGFKGPRRRLWRAAKEAVRHSLQYAYMHRRTRKRDFRRLWIARVNAAARSLGLNYSRLMAALRKANVELNRKVLAEIAVHDPGAFAALVNSAR
ncbi:50S ribosomal protein L20 [bacterium]|nr:50S ribosomal protein L20 [bacterium]